MPTNEMNNLRLHLLGPFEALTGNNLPVAITGKKPRALLAYLALANGQPVSRDKLASLLWEFSAEQQARTSLRQTLSSLRKCIPPLVGDPLISEGDTLAINSKAVVVDALDFEALIDGGTADALARASTLYRGELLDGMSLREEGFEEWLRGERARYRELALGALAKLFRLSAEKGEVENAARLAGRVLDLDPLREDIHRALMRLYAEQGQRGLALKQYERCRDVLRRELDVTPATKPMDNLSAYENVLRGQKLVHNYTQEDYANARRYFEHALSLDPNFARAGGWLAYVEIINWFWDLAPGGLDQAVRAGDAALALDDHESKSHLALGIAHLFRAEHEKAEYHLLRASELNPNDDLIMIENGRYLMYVDEPLAGADLVRQAMRRNPYHPNWYWNILGRCLHTGKLYDEAVSALERIRTPQFWVHAYLAACYAELGKSQDSARHLEAVFSLKPDFTISEFAKSLPYRDERALGEFIAGLRRGGLPA